jgi:2-desacetyl-2-hydroxyethyl bacteriochlorophyllide A dehydrogenase
MRALIIDSPRSARVEQVEIPVPGAGQAVVDVRRAGICGTDNELYTGELAYFAQGKSHFPLRPGHEWCGVVSAVGPGVDEAWIGERVTGDTMLGCGQCHRCAAGHGWVCADRHEIGIVGWPGALGEKLVVPANSLFKLPDAVDDCAGAMVEPGGNALRAVIASGAAPGKKVLIWGPGTIGLLAVGFASAAGAEVHMMGISERSRTLAERFGADHYWTADDPPPGCYDAVIDCTDDESVPASVIKYVEPAGRVVYIGISREPSLIDSRDLVLNNVTASGVLSASTGLADTIEHYADGRVDPRDLVQVVVGLDRATEVLSHDLMPGSGTKVHIDLLQ